MIVMTLFLMIQMKAEKLVCFKYSMITMVISEWLHQMSFLIFLTVCQMKKELRRAVENDKKYIINDTLEYTHSGLLEE